MKALGGLSSTVQADIPPYIPSVRPLPWFSRLIIWRSVVLVGFPMATCRPANRNRPGSYAACRISTGRSYQVPGEGDTQKTETSRGCGWIRGACLIDFCKAQSGRSRCDEGCSRTSLAISVWSAFSDRSTWHIFIGRCSVFLAHFYLSTCSR